jgi:hypothetical protein
MDSLFSFYYCIDEYAGHFGTVVILGAMLAGSLGCWLHVRGVKQIEPDVLRLQRRADLVL